MMNPGVSETCTSKLFSTELIPPTATEVETPFQFTMVRLKTASKCSQLVTSKEKCSPFAIAFPTSLNLDGNNPSSQFKSQLERSCSYTVRLNSKEKVPSLPPLRLALLERLSSWSTRLSTSKLNLNRKPKLD